MNRRTLFARLTALAAAPLLGVVGKVLPKKPGGIELFDYQARLLAASSWTFTPSIERQLDHDFSAALPVDAGDG